MWLPLPPLNKIWGELKFFKIKWGRKRGGKGKFLKFLLGGKLLEDETSNRKYIITIIYI